MHFHASNGTFNIKVVGYDTIPFYYNWENQTNGLTGTGTSNSDNFNIDNLSSGIYNITLTSPLPDTTIETGIYLREKLGSLFEIIEIKSTNSSNGTNNGSINIKISGGVPPYNFLWYGNSTGSQNGINNPDFSIPFLSQGEYDITVSDSQGNTQSVTVTLLDETVPFFPCKEPLNIVILNDVSGSVDSKEYTESKQFFVDFLSVINLGNNFEQSQAAIIEWSDNLEQEVRIPLTGDTSLLYDYVNYNRVFYSGTSIYEALKFGKEYLNNNVANDGIKVIVLSTDGKQEQIPPSLIYYADELKAEGFHIVTIAFDNAYSNINSRNILRQIASIDLLAPGEKAYSLLNKSLANNIVNLYLCPIDPGSSATVYFNRDGVIDILDINFEGNCPNPDHVEIIFTVQALRELSLPAGTKVTFYHNNPNLYSATPIFTWTMPCTLPIGEVDTFTIPLPINTPSKIYAVLNDDGSQSPPISFPITQIKELAYSNNIDKVSICTDDKATLQALKYTTTPIPTCDSIVKYTIDVCNISEVDAYDVKIQDIHPIDFILNGIVFNDNGCAFDKNGSYDIPAGCCISLTFSYNASGASHGYYNDQDVYLDGPADQIYINFDGNTTTSEDVILDGSIDCNSNIITFTKEVNKDFSCDDAFIIYTFTINNETNIPLQGLIFEDILPKPCEWVYKPYNLKGLSIGNSATSGNYALFVIDEVAANTKASFSMDAGLMTWDSDGELNNFATLGNISDPINNDFKTLQSNTVKTTISTIPNISLPDTIVVESNETSVSIDAILSGIGNVKWTTSGDGTFSDSNNNKTNYIFGTLDVEKGEVSLFINVSKDCGERGKDVLIIIKKCSIALENLTIGDCNDNNTPSNKDDDTYHITFNISAQNPGDQNTYSINIGQDSLGPFEYNKTQIITLPANGKMDTLLFKDSQINSCSIQSFVRQNNCSNECSLNFESINIGDCNDQGTPLISDDDTYELTFKITAQNTGSSSTYLVNQGTNNFGPFEYDKEQYITLKADGIIDTLFFKDSQKINCILQTKVSQNSCSNECQLTITNMTIGDCNNQNTPYDNQDDTYEISFSIASNNSGSNAKYMVTQGINTFGPFDYDVENKITLIADGKTDTLFFQDSEISGCIIKKEVNQISCSDECLLTLDEFIIGDCNDNDTPTDKEDDTYDIIFKLSALNSGISGTYTMLKGLKTFGPFEYDKEQNITLKADGTIDTLIFKDSDDTGCLIQREVSHNSCSDECGLAIEGIVIKDCNDNDTPTDKEDDTYDVVFKISKQNPGSANIYTVLLDFKTFGPFEYGKEQKITLKADGVIDTLIFEDNNTSVCLIKKEVSQYSCSNECALAIEEIVIEDCYDNDTPNNNEDDTYQVRFNLNAQNPGSANNYTVLLDSETFGPYDYGTIQKITLKADGTIDELVFKDSDKSGCLIHKEVTQTSCSNGEISDTEPIYIPNIFTPDGDSYNDKWKLTISDPNIKILKCYIFDRWGENVFYSSNTNQFFWDGKHNGNEVSTGVYTYIIEYKFKNDIQNLAGTITLIR